MEGWELSAREGGGGASKKGAEKQGSSWRALLTAPLVPQGLHIPTRRPGRESWWVAGLGGRAGR